jgi:Ala-tRNA(Pro) deacylase
MGIAATLKRHLQRQGIEFTVVQHPYAEGSINTAAAAHIPPHQLAKAVLFRDEDFNYTLAVIPASNKVKRYTINQIFDRHMELATEEETEHLFKDCSQGAIPPIGMAYNIDVIWDEELTEMDFIWIEAGDHEHLLRLNVENFKLLMADALHDHFSTQLRYQLPTKSPRDRYRSRLNQ